MSGRYLLDTNIIIALFASEASVINNLAQADEIFIPSIALGELYFGARKSGRSEKNLERIEDFATSNTIIECDASTARQYGDVKNRLRIKGRPLPENDVCMDRSVGIAVLFDASDARCTFSGGGESGNNILVGSHLDWLY